MSLWPCYLMLFVTSSRVIVAPLHGLLLSDVPHFEASVRAARCESGPCFSTVEPRAERITRWIDILATNWKLFPNFFHLGNKSSCHSLQKQQGKSQTLPLRLQDSKTLRLWAHALDILHWGFVPLEGLLGLDCPTCRTSATCQKKQQKRTPTTGITIPTDSHQSFPQTSRYWSPKQHLGIIASVAPKGATRPRCALCAVRWGTGCLTENDLPRWGWSPEQSPSSWQGWHHCWAWYAWCHMDASKTLEMLICFFGCRFRFMIFGL